MAKNKLRFAPQTLLTLGRLAKFHCILCKELAVHGEGAHVISLMDNGPRTYKNLSVYKNLNYKEINKKLNKVSNGIWLCPSCHTKIDYKNNINIYTIDFLLNIKKEHECNHEHYVKKKLRDQILKIK